MISVSCLSCQYVETNECVHSTNKLDYQTIQSQNDSFNSSKATLFQVSIKYLEHSSPM